MSNALLLKKLLKSIINGIQITRMVIKRSAWDELKEVNDIGLKDSKR